MVAKKGTRLTRAIFIRANTHNATDAIRRALLAANGVLDHVTILCWDRLGQGLPREELSYAHTIKRFCRTAPPRSLRIVLQTLRFQCWLLWNLLTTRADIVQVLDFESALPAAVVCRLTGSKLVYDMRDPFALSYNFPGLIRRIAYFLDWLMMGASSAFIVPSSERLEYLGRWARSGRPVLVMPNTCEDVSERVAQLNSRAAGAPAIIAFVGYLDRTRGAKPLLDLCRAAPGKIEIATAGVCRSRKLRGELETTPGVTMHGMLDRLQAFAVMMQAHAVALLYDPSVPVNRIAAPNKLYESLMLGTPVIVSENMSIAELVKREGLGYVVKYDDPAALSDAVEKLRDPAVLSEMRARCRSYFLKSCQLPKELERYTGFYLDLLGSRREGTSLVR